MLLYILWLFYTLFRSGFSRGLRLIFIVLRSLALLILVAMILDIRLDFSRWQNQAPETVILYDLSASMDSAWTKATLEDFNRHPLTQRLKKETQITRYGGGESATKLRSDPDYGDFIEPITDFESLISGTLEKYGSTPDQFVFLTDGQNLKGLETEQIALPRNISWLVLGVGDTLTTGRFTVVEWDVPEQVKAGDTTRISARIRYEGDSPAAGIFQLQTGTKHLAESRSLTFQNASVRDVTFILIPGEKGFHSLTLHFHEVERGILPVKGYTRLSVRPRELAVVIISAPDPDVRFIRTHLQTREGLTFFTPEQWEKTYPGESPHMLLLGPGREPETDLYTGIPAIRVRGCLEGEGRDVSGFRVTHPLSFTLLNDRLVVNREIWSRFPPVTVFPDPAGIPVLMDDEKKAVVIAYEDEKRSIIFNGCGFWRWAWAGYGTDREGAWSRLTDQMAGFLLASRQEWAWMELPGEALYAGISMKIPVIKGPEVDPGVASGRISLMDSTGSLVWNSSLTTLYQPVTPVQLPGLDPGSHLAVLDVFFQGEKVGSDSIILSVKTLNPEQRFFGCDIKSLQRWGGKQNGLALHVSRWGDGEQFLNFDEKYKRHVFHVDFRRNIIWILLLLILLTTEWIIRKTTGSE